METLADWQIEQHKKESNDLNRSGMFSIVRHPSKWFWNEEMMYAAG